MNVFSLPLALLLLALNHVTAELGLMTVVLEGIREKCLVEDLPERTVALIKHEAKLIDLNSRQPLTHIPFNLLITVRDPLGHTVIRQQGKPNGKLFMTASVTGEHTICFQSVPTQYVQNAGAKLALEIFIGDAGDPHITAPIEVHLHDLSYEIAKNNELVADIEVEQSLQREREKEFRSLSESVNSWTVKMALLQLAVLVGTCAFQMHHLKKFFQYKKIV